MIEFLLIYKISEQIYEKRMNEKHLFYIS